TGESWNLSEIRCISANYITFDEKETDWLLRTATDIAVAQNAIPRILNTAEIRLRHLIARSAFEEANLLLTEIRMKLPNKLDNANQSRLNDLMMLTKVPKASPK